MSEHCYDSVRAPKPNVLNELFGKPYGIVIGVVHAKPLPGSPNYEGESMEEIYEHVIEESRRYLEGGVDGIIIENHGDIPFLKPDKIGYETVACMAIMVNLIKKETNLRVGVNVLANGAIQAMAVAKAGGADFIRVNQWVNAYIANEGFIEGPAAEVTRYRSWLGAKTIKIFSDILVKHGSHFITSDRSLDEQVKDAEWFDTDAIIVTGKRTGDSPNIDELKKIKSISSVPILVGSGADQKNVKNLLSVADGCIVASSLKEDNAWWNLVDVGKVKKFVQVVKSLERG